jgi:hypothetical protein
MGGLSERDKLDGLAATARLFRPNIEEILDMALEEGVTRIVPIEKGRRPHAEPEF